MECNKEEAIRAKDIAEKRMQCRDFIGARKMVLKAQQLFPDLENTLQILTVCEVHCSAETKVHGLEDWYGILQVEPTADDSWIKKQYKKLAFLLHPDKNKFAGAEAAFKLVGEAHRILTDQTKRSVYDLKMNASRKAVGPNPAHQTRPSATRKQPEVPKNYTTHPGASFANLNQTWATQQQTHASQTFWTACPSCGIRYQYYSTMINRALRCQNCLKPFVACDINAQGVPTGMKFGCPLNQSGIFQHKDSEIQKNASQKGNGEGGSSNMDTQENAGGRSTVPEPVTRAFGQGNRNKMQDSRCADNGTGGKNEVKVEKVKLEKVNKRGPSRNASQKRQRKTVMESSDRNGSDSASAFETSGNAAASNTGNVGGRYPRRSGRQKQNVAYNEDKDNSDADDLENSSGFKRSRTDGSSHCGDQGGKTSSGNDVDAAPISKNNLPGASRSIYAEEDMPSINKQEGNGMKESRDTTGKGATEKNSKDGATLNPGDPEIVIYADPEFHDFDKHKSFAIGQIWAMYDDIDAMPRFYARIKNVSSSGFKVHFTWLEYDPIDRAKIDWYDKKLPVGCGEFTLGETENSDDIRMFSHLTYCMKGSKRNSYVVYPRKGEVWALLKGWDSKWRLHPDEHRQYEYEVVQVLSDFSVDTGVDTVYLVRVEGFVSLFCQGTRRLHIPHGELLRFSHMVPSYRLTGKEREGIPEGMFELDCASLPTNWKAMFPSVALNEIRGNVDDTGHENGVPAFIPGTRESKGADEYEVHCTIGSNIKTNGKIQVETPPEVPDISSEGLKGIHKSKNGQAGGSKSAAVDLGKTASDRMPSDRLVNVKEKHLDGPSTSTGNAVKNHNDAMPDALSHLYFVYPDSEFYRFELERSKETFKPGQIWALYCEEDGFPKYYALVSKVDSGDFKVHVTWLDCCPQLQEDTKWANNELPFGCGRFKLCSGRHAKETYDTVETFSHLVVAAHVEKKPQYDIYPQINEVWALYRNWSVHWQLSDVQNCYDKADYEIVEVIHSSDSVMKVKILEKVDGFKSVFRAKRTNGNLTTLDVFRNEFLKFSHRIPSFRLTEQRGGKLRDCWELDPASVPEIFCRKTN
ncbi:hypothetical protein Taro_006132 [Colocasia esculenta]|uniref:J domain-containing protein n=1 Tax=Colocasia esculenta TaxID=4460 RepID=A0A843TQ75_COLES|nr:hypothetical protein [Colocasia esculenta]